MKYLWNIKLKNDLQEKETAPKESGRSLFVGITPKHYFHVETAIEKVIVHATPVWWSRGKSIALWCCRRRALRQADVHRSSAFDWFDSPSSSFVKRKTTQKGGFSFGGASATKSEHPICSETSLIADEFRTSNGIFSNSTPRLPPFSMIV